MVASYDTAVDTEHTTANTGSLLNVRTAASAEVRKRTKPYDNIHVHIMSLKKKN